MGYKVGDKVVVEIKEVHHAYVFIKRNGNDNFGHAIDYKEVLDKMDVQRDLTLHNREEF